MEKGTIALIIGIFILVGLAYSPVKENFENKKNNSTNTTTSNTSIGTANNNYSSNEDASRDIEEAQDKIKKLEKELEKKIEESKRSTYYGKIRTSNIQGIRNSDPNEEYIILDTYLQNGEKVNITGWYFKSEITGYYAFIGKAALLPFPFNKTESDIILQKNDRVYVTKGFSPIGISFRTNMCTGYFEENRTFIPSLQKSCPKVADEDLPNFSSIYDRNDECIDLIHGIPRCTTRNGEYFRDLPDTVTSSCKAYIETNINYNACVAHNFDNTDFPGNEYRVYLNKFGDLWRKNREKVNLHDASGLIVDTITIN